MLVRLIGEYRWGEQLWPPGTLLDLDAPEAGVLIMEGLAVPTSVREAELQAAERR